MRRVRFFEDSNGPKEVNDGRRLLVGIMDYDENPVVDGGRREAVRVATLSDASEFQTEYAEYYRSFGPVEAVAEPEGPEEREPLQPPPIEL
jgi:hypothetical protein